MKRLGFALEVVGLVAGVTALCLGSTPVIILGAFMVIAGELIRSRRVVA